MRLLALDTATEACSAAVLCTAEASREPPAPGEAAGMPPGSAASAAVRLYSRYEEPGRGHSERILAMVDEVLAEARVALGSLDAIAFGRGPGGFTGVRLAASVTQGLAFATGLPVVPISDLRAVAQRLLDDAADARTVLVCADARMREVYWGWFQRDAAGLAQPCPGDAERVGAPDSVGVRRGTGAAMPGNAGISPIDATAQGPDGRAYGAGRGFSAYPQLEAIWSGRLAAIHADLLPRAAEIARLAAADFAAGLAVPAHEAIPVYLRDDVARPRP